MSVFVRFVCAFVFAIVKDHYLSHADTYTLPLVMLLLNNYT